MRHRGPIRYRKLDDGEKPTATRLANIRAIDEILADNSVAAQCIGAPGWYIVRCQSGQERISAAHLAGRRFGVYLPERKTDVPMYPGYLFVHAFSIVDNHRRIMGCPGVIEIMGGDRPHAISFDVIDEIRKSENIARSQEVAKLEDVIQAPKVRRRRRSRLSKKIRRALRASLDKSRRDGLSDDLPNGRGESCAHDSRLDPLVLLAPSASALGTRPYF